jgi:hypothetical protein
LYPPFSLIDIGSDLNISLYSSTKVILKQGNDYQDADNSCDNEEYYCDEEDEYDSCDNEIYFCDEDDEYYDDNNSNEGGEDDKYVGPGEDGGGGGGKYKSILSIQQ